jgi:hypothetical protein
MKLEVLIGGLNNPQPAVRLDVVRVLGMVDETRALPVLRQQYESETDPTVRSAMAWAGKRLYEVQQAGYSTIDELCRHFGIDREIENMPSANEAEMMQRMQNQFERDMAQRQMRANVKQAGMAAAAGLGVSMMAGATAGMGAMLGGMGAGAGLASSNLGDSGRPQIGTQRSPATAPSSADISVWVRRLREGASAGQREQAAIELAQINNPAALPHLAAAFVGDSSPQVQQAAQRFGKILYWSAIYWAMEQDGSMAKEMERRAAALGKTVRLTNDTTTPPPDSSATASPSGPAPAQPSSEPPVDVSDILRKAQQGRAERKRKKR